MAKPVVAIIDDDPDILTFMDEVLADEGYRTVFWRQSDGAYDLIKRTMPDLVILDMRMEYADAGMLVLDLLRLDPATRHIPVIVCSANVQVMRDQVARLRDHGCAMLDKPFSLDDLLATIREALDPIQ